MLWFVQQQEKTALLAYAHSTIQHERLDNKIYNLHFVCGSSLRRALHAIQNGGHFTQKTVYQWLIAVSALRRAAPMIPAQLPNVAFTICVLGILYFAISRFDTFLLIGTRSKSSSALLIPPPIAVTEGCSRLIISRIPSARESVYSSRTSIALASPSRAA